MSDTNRLLLVSYLIEHKLNTPYHNLDENSSHNIFKTTKTFRHQYWSKFETPV